MPATTARLAAPGSITNGQFGLFRWDMNPGSGGASAHIHKTFSESLLHALGSWLLDEHVYQKRYLPRFRSSHAQAAKLASDPSALQKDEDAAKTLLARVCLTGKVNSTGTNTTIGAVPTFASTVPLAQMKLIVFRLTLSFLEACCLI